MNSAGALRFGGNNVWSEWFSGQLDEIRIYDRALTQAELQTRHGQAGHLLRHPAAAAGAVGVANQHVLHRHPGRRQSGARRPST